MASRNNALEDHLARASEITITVTGRKSGRAISLPIWFVWDDGILYLLPVKGSDTQWYKNLLQNPSMQIEAGGVKSESQATPITAKAEVLPVIEKFRAKYAGDVKKYYSKFDVAVVAQTR
jgi:deazaflavin-dependent oxidoreductase (nitroreductase family)